MSVAAPSTQIRIGRRVLDVRNIDKVLYPAADFTKGDVIHYYLRVANVLLPHLKNRPLTLKRYPNGTASLFFYEKRCPIHRPKWMPTTEVVGGKAGPINFCVVNDAISLAWIANLASLELHPLLSRAPKVEQPTMMVFDFDPGPPAGVTQAASAAILVRDFLEKLGLKSFPKTSGGKGIHLAVPLNTPVTFDDTKSFSRAIAQTLERQFPDKIISNMSKALRKNKVFVDWSQNDEHKTTACVYSLRARDYPTVSTPITWKELEDAVKKDDPDRISFQAHDVIDRVARFGDLFAPVLKLKQKLPTSLA
jgi:bifunctional non-homologous end joining protein LigD